MTVLGIERRGAAAMSSSLDGLSDPNANQFPYWNDTTGAMAWGSFGAGLTFSAGVLSADSSSSLTLASLTLTGSLTVSNGITVTAGGLTVTAGGLTITAGTLTAVGVTCTSLTDSGLTSGRVPRATTGGLLTDSANLTFDGTTLTAHTATVSAGNLTVSAGQLTVSGTGINTLSGRLDNALSINLGSASTTTNFLGINRTVTGAILNSGITAYNFYHDGTNLNLERYTGVGAVSGTFIFQAGGAFDFKDSSAISNIAGSLIGAIALRGGITFNTDNTVDIGAAGATRPRTGYFGTSVSVLGTVSGTGVLALGNGTPPTAQTDTVGLYSSDIAAGHTEPSFFCEGTQVLATGQADSASSVRVKMRINGTEVTLLAI